MQTFHIDKLQISFRTAAAFDELAAVLVDNYTIVDMPQIKCYSACYGFKLKGSQEIVFRVFWSNYLQPEFHALKIENWVFYTQISINQLIDDFINLSGVEFSHNQVIDLAYDIDSPKLCGVDRDEVVVLHGQQKIRREGKYRRSFFGATINPDDKITIEGKQHTETIYFGKWNFCVKSYDKITELKKSEKKYIRDLYIKLGAVGTVYRHELTIQNEAQKRVAVDGCAIRIFRDYDNLKKLWSVYVATIRRNFTMEIQNKDGSWKKTALLELNDDCTGIEFVKLKRGDTYQWKKNTYTIGVQQLLQKTANGQKQVYLSDEQKNILLEASEIIKILNNSTINSGLKQTLNIEYG